MSLRHTFLESEIYILQKLKTTQYFGMKIFENRDLTDFAKSLSIPFLIDFEPLSDTLFLTLTKFPHLVVPFKGVVPKVGITGT